jgi:signal transduction histidine kinase
MATPRDAEELEAGIAALCELMSAVSHDLRTPLTPIKGYAEILRTRPGLGPERIEQYATTIVLAAARMEHDIDLVAGLAALYGGRAELRADKVGVATLIDERIEKWRGRVPDREFSADADDAVVIADAQWLARAVDELVEHAVRTLPAEGPVMIRGALSDDGVRVTFSASLPSGPGDGAGPPAGRLAMSFISAVCDVCGFTVSAEPFALGVPTA